MSELNVCINVFVCAEKIRFDLTVPPLPSFSPFYFYELLINFFKIFAIILKLVLIGEMLDVFSKMLLINF